MRPSLRRVVFGGAVHEAVSRPRSSLQAIPGSSGSWNDPPTCCQRHTVRVLTQPLASTRPRNGDVNPYGEAVILRSTGNLRQGNVLVSNFNYKANVNGTGTTIVEITPHGRGVRCSPRSNRLHPPGP